MKKRSTLIILGVILLIGLFFRSYQIVERFNFDHDNDLLSWIVKDITVNHHLRLIGQLTSAPGIFIGPFFYYVMVPFYNLTSMDPVGSLIPMIILGILTTLSYYFVFSRLFNKEVGLIASFLYAASAEIANFDRQIVPSTPTNIWTVWYFWVILSLARGSYSTFPLLGFLIGLIWHVHIALIPVLITVPVAIIISRKLPNFSQIKYFFVALILPSIPLIIFEIRHHFIQIIAFLSNFIQNHGGDTGLYKYSNSIITKVTQNIYLIFFHNDFLSFLNTPMLIYGLLFASFFLLFKKILKKNDLIIFFVWMIGVLSFYTFSTTLVSEYYLDNLDIIFVAIISLYLYLLYRIKFFGNVLLFIILGGFLFINLKNFIPDTIYHKGYTERKGLADYISKDSKEKGYPCIGVSYITSPGENVGFRYFFYLNNLHLVHPSVDVPVYNIVIPDELALREVKLKFGHIGVIPPTNIPSKEAIDKSCQTPNTNLTDPMLGYVE